MSEKAEVPQAASQEPSHLVSIQQQSSFLFLHLGRELDLSAISSQGY